MTQITLIRHGQANSTARDEASYDRLSELGRRQSEWLGAYLRDTGATHMRLVTGTLTRHVETAAAMETGLEPVQDARLNELEYFTMANLLREQHGVPMPTCREDFATHLPLLFRTWENGELDGAPESFASFDARVQGALADLMAGHGPALVVTSGGLISMVMRQALGLDSAGMAKLALAIMNSSLHQMHPIGDGLAPVLFNAVPHLATPERQFAQTHF